MTKKKKKKRPPRFAGLKQLPCFEEIRERILAGYPLAEIARYVQDEEGLYLHASRRSLAEALRRFVEKEIAPAGIVASKLPDYVAKATAEFGNRLEDLRRLERAYEVSEYRIALAHAQERRTGKINPQVDHHLKVIVDVVVRMHHLKMDLGLTGAPELGALTVSPERLAEIRERYGEGAAAAFADPVQRAQVLGLLKRVMRLRSRADIGVDEVVDGDDDASLAEDTTSAPPPPAAAPEAARRLAAPYMPILLGDDDDDEDGWQ